MSVPYIDLGLIAFKNAAEIERMLKALHDPGFFFLDLGTMDQSKEIINLKSMAYQTAKDYFGQSILRKIRDARKDIPSSSDRGFVFLSFEDGTTCNIFELTKPSRSYKFCESDESYEAC